MLQSVRITFMLGGISDDASHFRLVNEFWREDGELCARLASTGGWLDIKARKLIPPPVKLADALRLLEKTADFAEMKSSVR